MPFLRITLRLILSIDVRFHYTSSWTGMVRSGFPRAAHEFDPLNFSKTTQRQFSGEPIGPKPLSLSPHIDNTGREAAPGDCDPDGEGKTTAADLCR